MAYTQIEIIALIVILFSIVKLIMAFINPKAWMNFAKSFYKNTFLIQIVLLILGAYVLYLLINNGISIVEIFAVLAFIALLMGVGLANQVESLIQKYESHIKKGNLFRENWLYILIWLALLIWGLKEILM